MRAMERNAEAEKTGIEKPRFGLPRSLHKKPTTNYANEVRKLTTNEESQTNIYLDLRPRMLQALVRFAIELACRISVCKLSD